MEKFCADVNSGAEPRRGVHGRYLLRVGDDHLPATGLPNVPERYQKLLLNAPIEAKVIAIGRIWTTEQNDYHALLTLDVGSEQGVVQRMPMRRIEPGTWLLLHVNEISERTCVAELAQSGPNPILPVLGWKFSSKISNGE